MADRYVLGNYGSLVDTLTDSWWSPKLSAWISNKTGEEIDSSLTMPLRQLRLANPVVGAWVDAGKILNEMASEGPGFNLTPEKGWVGPVKPSPGFVPHISPKESKSYQRVSEMVSDHLSFLLKQEKLSSRIGLDAEIRETLNEIANLLIKKNHDYGTKNIGLSPGGAINGLRVRLYDKLARLNNLYESGAKPENESLMDTADDIIGYGVILKLVLSGKWPTE